MGGAFVPTEPFVPATGLGSPHAQTLFGLAARPRHLPLTKRECWETPDGDFLEVELRRASPERPHLFVLHGLEGSSQKGYVRSALLQAAARGWGALALNFRSCGGEPNRVLRSYNSGATEDPRWVLQRLREAGVTGPLLGLGFSLGANVLLRLLEEDEDKSLLTAAVAVCAPLDLSACADSLDGPGFFARVYREYLLRPLKKKGLQKAKSFPGKLDEVEIRATRQLRQFDHVVTAPSWGYASAEDYYEKCSSGPQLEKIARPTLLLSAADDPFVPASSFPSEERLRAMKHVQGLLTAQGGHVGHVAGSSTQPRWWAEEQAAYFLAHYTKR